MVDEEGRKVDKFDEFDDTGESLGYISLEQARVLAMRTARDESGSYGAEFQGMEMFFEAEEEEEGEDYYVITLSFRPQGDFSGTPGREQFFITKEGSVDHRQVMGLPSQHDGETTSSTPERKRSVVPLIIGGVIVIVAIAVAAFFLLPFGSEESTAAVAIPQSAPPVVAPTASQQVSSVTQTPAAAPVALSTPNQSTSPAPAVSTGPPTVAAPTPKPVAAPATVPTPAASSPAPAAPTPVMAITKTASVPRATLPDEGLRAAINAALGKGSQEPITNKDLLAVTRLEAKGKNISSLTGIDQCVNLVYLDLQDNLIEDITEIATLGKLEQLILSNNPIKEFGPVGSQEASSHSSIHGSLTKLDLSNTGLKDTSQIVKFGNLEELYLNNNQLQQFDAHKLYLSYLRRLSINGNNIAEINPLAGNELIPCNCSSGLLYNDPLETLEYLDLRENPLNLWPESHDLRNIQSLIDMGVEVNHDPITEAPSTAENPSVKFPDLLLDMTIREAIGKNRDQTITADDLSGLSGLNLKDLQGGGLEDLSGFEYLVNIKHLNLDNSFNHHTVSRQPLESLRNLIWLELDVGSPEDLNYLASLTKLEHLELTYIGPSSMDSTDLNQIQRLTELKHLTIGEGFPYLKDISALANLTKLESLGINRSMVEDVNPLATLTNLEVLSLRDQNIKEVNPLESLTNLKKLWLDGNQINDARSLTMSLCNLEFIDLGNNPLNRYGESFYCNQNLDVDW